MWDTCTITQQQGARKSPELVRPCSLVDPPPPGKASYTLGVTRGEARPDTDSREAQERRSRGHGRSRDLGGRRELQERDTDVCTGRA